MRLSSAFVSLLSLSLFSGALAFPSEDINAIEAREASSFELESANLPTRDLETRAKQPKVTFDIGKGKGKLSSKDRQLAQEAAEDALSKYKYKAGTVVYAYHLSNGETVEHITIQPDGSGKAIHAYRDGIITQGDERRPGSRAATPDKRSSDIEARAKQPKVTFNIGKGKGKLSSKDRQLAQEAAEDALSKYGYKAGTVVYAYHLSNGETVEHITVQPDGSGKAIHAYRDGIITQGDERRPGSRSPTPDKRNNDIEARAKQPKVTFNIGKGKGKLSSKDRQLAQEAAEDALSKYGYKAGTVVYAYHVSNGETVEHITIQPDGSGKAIHAYRDGVITQGDERRPGSRSPTPDRKRHPHAAPEGYGALI